MPFSEPVCHKCGEFLPAPGARCPFCAAYQPKKHYLDDNPQTPLRGHDEYEMWTPPQEVKPDWAIDGIVCPGCGDELFWSWVWAGEFNLIDDDNEDHPVWFMVCEKCETNYDLLDNKPVECK